MPPRTEQILCPHLLSNFLSVDDSARFPLDARVIIFPLSDQYLYAICLSSAVPGTRVAAENQQ